MFWQLQCLFSTRVCLSAGPEVFSTLVGRVASSLTGIPRACRMVEGEKRSLVVAEARKRLGLGSCLQQAWDLKQTVLPLAQSLG